MAGIPFRPLQWNPNEVLTKGKMDQIAFNEQYLFDNMPRAQYAAHGVRRDEGIKIASGFALIRATRRHHNSRAVYFGNFFSARTQPVVTTGAVSNYRRQLHVTLEGFGRLFPDHRGFRVYVVNNVHHKANRPMKRNMYVGWIALGY